MESLGLFEIMVIALTSLGGAGLIYGVGLVLPRFFGSGASQDARHLDPTFLFDGGMLVDATPDAQNMIKDAPKNLSERDAVLGLFQDRFPTLDYVMSHLAPGQVEVLPAADAAQMSLRIEDANGLTRVTLFGATEDDGLSISEMAAQDGITRELRFLRDLVDASPHLMWTQDINGRLTWANAAYMNVSDAVSTGEGNASQRWPDQTIFPDLHLDARTDEPVVRRAAITLPESQKQEWFDVTTQKHDREVIHFASRADAAVVAEQSKIKAMQTSGRLFGNLSTGLAIFDQKRRLTIFNPSLTDLTRLKPDFLAGRPTLDTFLDALRESRILPEPKNYSSWRDQFSALETAARDGTYCENWDTIDGQTFRVTGKPYSDNSFVFLFDDITAEVALTRRFRTDIETGQSVIDTLSDAIVVFSANSTLVMSNRAYKDLWGSDHDGSMHSHQLRGEIVTWQKRCAASASWAELRNYIAATTKSETWVDHLILEDGRHVAVEAKAINGRSTMITFKLKAEKEMKPVLHKLTLSDPSIQSLKS